MKTDNQSTTFSTDLAISHSKEDKLGFVNLAVSLAKTIADRKNETSVVIGIEGAWGSGKSSILNLFENEVQKEQYYSNYDKKIGPLIVRFNPWLITNRASLISSFFNHIDIAIKTASTETKQNGVLSTLTYKTNLDELKDKFLTFGEVATKYGAPIVAIVDPTLISTSSMGIFSKGMGFLKHLRQSKKQADLGIENQKKILKKLLLDLANSDPSFRIVVIIDDLDRLDPGDALEILRLIKAVADFPTISYILAYDQPILAKAIESSLSVFSGDDYLEKIIQFAIKVPPLEPFQLRRWLRSELESLYHTDADFTSQRCSAILDVWAGMLIKSPRDIKRLIISISLIWCSIKENADLLDLVWLQLIRLKASGKTTNLYKWVIDYLGSLDAMASGGSVNGKLESCKELEQILLSLGWRNAEIGPPRTSLHMHYMNRLLLGINEEFLSIEKEKDNVWAYNYNSADAQEFRTQRRLSSPWHWRYYFSFSAPSFALTDVEWVSLEECALKGQTYLENKLTVILDHSANTRPDLSDQLIDRLIFSIQNSLIANAIVWFRAFVFIENKLFLNSKPDFMGFGLTIDREISKLASTVFEHVAKQDKIAMLKELINEAPSLISVSLFYRHQKSLMNKPQHQQERHLYIETDKEWNEIDAVFESRLKQMDVEQFSKNPYAFDILFAWKDLTGDFKAPSQYFFDAIKTDENFIQCLESAKCVSSTTQNGIPHINANSLGYFEDKSKIKTRLLKLAKANSAPSSRAQGLLDVWYDGDF